MIGMVFAAGSKEQTAAAQEGTKLTFWTFQDLHMSFYKEMAKRWNAQYPDRQINFVGEVLPYEDMHTKLLVSL